VSLTLHARRYDDGRPVHLAIDDGRIASVEAVDPTDAADWPLVAPAFFDLQINGYGGVWFSDVGLTVDQVLTVLEAHFAKGITRLCPTVITNSFEAMRDGLATVRAACEREPWADRMVPACHVEGPYISPEDGPRGAHPLEHVRGCDVAEFERWQAASGDRIRLITLAPESPGAVEFIRHVTGRDVRVSIGHTAANTEQIAAAIDAGATLSTHLGNGAHGTIRRHPNYIWDQLGDDRLCASVIADGHHLPASVLRSMIRAKGWQKIILTCDSSGLAGLLPGEYEYGGRRFEVLADGPIVMAGQRQYLAGSGQHTDICVANAVALAGVTLYQACEMAQRHPARLLGFDAVTLAAGARADLILFRYAGPGSRLEIEATLADGAIRHGTMPSPL
jgi:N-acetylglucosamine-6-phosphate deacetylase